jgi:hypothetical protein
MAVPLLRVVDVFSENEPIPNWGFPVGEATSEIVPPFVFGGAGVTVTVKLTFCPCLKVMPEAGVVIATVFAVNDAVDHAVRRFPTFSEPRPVAKS